MGLRVREVQKTPKEEKKTTTKERELEVWGILPTKAQTNSLMQCPGVCVGQGTRSLMNDQSTERQERGQPNIDNFRLLGKKCQTPRGRGQKQRERKNGTRGSIEKEKGGGRGPTLQRIF